MGHKRQRGRGAEGQSMAVSFPKMVKIARVKEIKI
jgi:hypothetical protein